MVMDDETNKGAGGKALRARRFGKKVEKDPLGEIQQALFRVVRIRRNAVPARVFAIEAYFNQLVIDAAGGKVAAMREVNKLGQYIERSELARAAVVPLSPASKKLSDEIKDREVIYGMICKVRGATFLSYRSKFREKL
jgi:hypothetical protein